MAFWNRKRAPEPIKVESRIAAPQPKEEEFTNNTIVTIGDEVVNTDNLDTFKDQKDEILEESNKGKDNISKIIEEKESSVEDSIEDEEENSEDELVEEKISRIERPEINKVLSKVNAKTSDSMVTGDLEEDENRMIADLEDKKNRLIETQKRRLEERARMEEARIEEEKRLLAEKETMQSENTQANSPQIVLVNEFELLKVIYEKLNMIDYRISVLESKLNG